MPRAIHMQWCRCACCGGAAAHLAVGTVVLVCPFGPVFCGKQYRRLSQASAWHSQVVLVWNQQGRQQQLRSLARHLWRQEQVRRARSVPLLQSVWANLHSGQGNVILGPHWQHLHGCSESWYDQETSC